MCIAPNQDLELLKLYTADNYDPNVRLIASSFRIQPKIFPNAEHLEIFLELFL